ncbi:hypothetical protein GCM10019059_31460 [Camelimonas fluminis]|nr:hypothetical protein GCM10019059_31460 [Camelimonas fluminis]
MNIHKNARLTPIGRERLVRRIAGGQTAEAAAPPLCMEGAYGGARITGAGGQALPRAGARDGEPGKRPARALINHPRVTPSGRWLRAGARGAARLGPR